MNDLPRETPTVPENPGLFEAYGVEIEMMIVDEATLDVKPVCDTLIGAVAGEATSDVEFGEIAWSNELTLHVLEFKTNGPAPTLSGLAARFHENVRTANGHLGEIGARLMPGAMHPWMDPASEARLWPHEYTEVYHTFDRIFGCTGHGWANLQSTHLNLPFASDEEFGRLHAAIRIVLPLIPALAASSPFQDGRVGGATDGRMIAYRGNARRVPSVAGGVIPEVVFTRQAYERDILGRIYSDMAELDPEGVLRHEWVNARGAIARFDRGAIEIRVIDSQERPTADLAVLAAVVSVVRSLTSGALSERNVDADPSSESLRQLLEVAVVQGEQAVVDDRKILSVLGLPTTEASLGDVWRALLDAAPPEDPAGEFTSSLEMILDDGPLARRMLVAAGPNPAREDLERVARALCECLERNEPFKRAV